MVDQDSAVQALETIVHQGEGSSSKDPDDEAHELAHYYKFAGVLQALQARKIDPARDVYPLVTDPTASSYDTLQQVNNLTFNSIYSILLDSLQESFSSPAPNIYAGSTKLMNGLRQAAATLRGTGTVGNTGLRPGPSFEYILEVHRKA